MRLVASPTTTLWLWLTVPHGIDGPLTNGLPINSMVDLSMASPVSHNQMVSFYGSFAFPGFPDPKSSTGPQDEKVVDIVQLGAHVNRATSDPQRYVAVGCGSQASFLWVVTCSNHHITTQRE